MQARGRASTLPNKNLYLLNGKPMIWHHLNELQKCQFIDEICVWTDSSEIKEIVEDFGCFAVERPRDMIHYGAGFHPPREWDDYVGASLLERFGTTGDIKVYLNCNYVLLKAQTLEAMYDKLMEDECAEIIFPVYTIDPHIYMINPNTNYLFPVWDSPRLDRQKFPQLFRKVGIAIHHPGRPVFKHVTKELFHEIPRSEGLDVQNEDDVKFAEYILDRRARGE